MYEIGPVLTYTELAVGLIVMIASSYVIYKIYQGSKSTFAYALMGFALLEGGVNFSDYFIFVFRQQIIADGKTYQVVNIYALVIVEYLYFMVCLQQWLFGMKYLESAMLCSLTLPCIQPQKVSTIKWVGFLLYSFVLIACCVWGLISYPGYVNDNSLGKFEKWFVGTWVKITGSFWMLATLSSIGVTLFAICMILRTAKELEKYNSQVSINRRALVFHAGLLALQSSVAVCYVLEPFIPYFADHLSLISTVLIIVGVFVQLAMCYICLTMGSSVQLRKFKLTLDCSTGAPKVVVRLRESLVESEISFDDQLNESDISVNSEIEFLKRDQSLMNERGCDEIMQQFMEGLESFCEATQNRISADFQEAVLEPYN